MIGKAGFINVEPRAILSLFRENSSGIFPPKPPRFNASLTSSRLERGCINGVGRMPPKMKTDETVKGPSLDYTLHETQTKIAPTRLAAMQILIYNMELSNDEESNVTAEDFLDAKSKLREGYDAAKDFQSYFLTTHELDLPESLSDTLGELVVALEELVRITDRCSVADGEIKGFRPSPTMYDLCCTRIAKGVNAFSDELRVFFLELNDKGKVDALDRVNTIAMEIGKIGRVINMVATNASIVAARAGDAGKGFNVIADEVKVLSTRVSSLSVSLTDRLHVN
ncbi:MAG: methyl-accepting chemotaxis protein [Paracoccaceae bacterium]|nr:methyl-accepting chemotaxis protein [Paracoccaceae bacterium]